MVQDFVDATYRWLLGSAALLRESLWFLLAALVGGCVLGLACYRLRPEESSALAAKAKDGGRRACRIATLFFAVLILDGTLVQARKMVAERRAVLQQATTSRRNEPQLSGVVQYAPSVAFLRDRTYTRTLTLPPNFLERIGTEGVQVLAPYLSDPSADDVLKMVDSFKRSGRDVVFTRELTRRDEIPIAADSAQVLVDFKDHGAPSGQRHYEVTFAGTYRFHNPNSAPAVMRFNFHPPQGGGTIQGFYFDADGQRVTEPDDHGLYVWTATIPALGTVEAVAHYRVTGGGAYNYALGSERRRIGSFQMTATSGHELQFGRSGIFPSQVNGSEASWSLHDVLTAQSIQLQFPRTDLQAELLDKTLSVLPLALALFAAGALWLRPDRATVAVSLFGIGLLSIPVLSAYTSPGLSTVTGAVMSLMAAGWILRGRSGWILAIIASASLCAFLTVEHGALVAWVMSAVVVMLLAFSKRATRHSISQTGV